MDFEDNPEALTSPTAAAADLTGGGPTPTPGDAGEREGDPAASQPDFEKLAAEVEAELEAEGHLEPTKKLEGAEPAKDEPATPAPVSEKPTRSSVLQKIIDTKFGGDEDKFAASVYEQQNSTARLYEELQELKKALPTKEEAPPTPEEHPDLGWVNQEITSLQAETEQNRLRQEALVTEGRSKREEILQLKGEMRRADDIDKKELQQQINLVESELSRMNSEWRDLDKSNRRLASEQRDLARRKELAEREVISAREEQRTQAIKDKEDQVQELQKFEKAVSEVAKDNGLTDKEVIDDMYETARAKAALYIRINGEVPDLGALTKQFCERYLNVHKLAKKAEFAQLSRQKVEASRPVNPNPAAKAPAAPSPQSPSRAKEKQWTPEFVRMRAAKLLGGS